MRSAAILAATLALLLAGGRPALGSCFVSRTLAENASGADAVVYGRVAAVAGRALTVSVLRALKGSVPATITVYVGPGRNVQVTSVDYPDLSGPPEVGSKHVLYVTKVPDGYETNACVGSHPGAPTDEERAFFGTAAAPSVGPSPAPPSPAPTAAPAADPAAPDRAVLIAVGAAAVLAAATLLLRRRPLSRGAWTGSADASDPSR